MKFQKEYISLFLALVSSLVNLIDCRSILQADIQPFTFLGRTRPPLLLRGAGGGFFKKYAYLGGGQSIQRNSFNPSIPTLINFTNEFFRFDSETGQWETLSPLPTKRVGFVSASTQTWCIFNGGTPENQNEGQGALIWRNFAFVWTEGTILLSDSVTVSAVVNQRFALFANRATIFIFDSELIRPTTTLPLSQSREYISAAGNNRFAFFAGGQLARNTQSYSNVIDVWDSETELLSRLTLSRARAALATACVGSFVLFAGGYARAGNSETGPQGVVDILDLQNNKWSISSLSVPRYLLTAANIGPFAIFAGGTNDTFDVPINNTVFSTIDIWDSRDGSWLRLSLVFPQYSPFIFPILDTNTVLIGNGIFDDIQALYVHGFDIFSYTPPPPETTLDSQIGLIVGLSVGGFVLLLIGVGLFLLFIFYPRLKKLRSKNRVELQQVEN